MRLERVKIGEIAKVKGGKRLPQGYDVQDEPTDHPYLRVVDFDDNGLNPAHVKFISNEVHEKIRRYTITDEDIFVSIAGTIGRVGIVPELFSRANLTENAAKITDISESVDALYLYYFLKGHTGQELLKSKAGGTSQPKLALYRLAEIEFPKPSFQAQRRIARVLSACDDLIENNRQRIALLEEAARLLYREWFVHLRFPGHEHIEITGGLPQGWDFLPSSRVIEVNPKTLRSSDGMMTYVPMNALSQSGMTVDRVTLEKRQKSTSVRFRNGDTLFARITPCLENGKTGFVQFLAQDEVACGSTEFIVLRGEKVSNYFVYLTSRQREFRENAIHSMIGSSGRQRVQSSCFDRYLVASPPHGMAMLFDEIVGEMFKQIANLDQQNQKLAQARDVLLPRLMNGEIAV